MRQRDQLTCRPPTAAQQKGAFHFANYTAKLSESQEDSHGQSVSAGLPPTNIAEDEGNLRFENDEVDNLNRGRSPPPQYPYSASEASASTSFSLTTSRPAPPPFSSLYAVDDHFKLAPTTCGPTSEAGASSATAAPAYAPSESAFDSPLERSTSFDDTVAETKRALPQDVKGESSQKVDDPNEPPPAYSEGYSPLLSFTYLMAAAGGASSIITQVQQGGPPVNAIGGKRREK
ncbi:hypothetical protein Daesc_002460 [Daldinia eschscholtzii]|uniref:Proteophosphoglycan ppg4 n=1 Tax=Daldinia eschscholtzii TaxID=292717 RepID=A0AAX6MXF0_9PEZI